MARLISLVFLVVWVDLFNLVNAVAGFSFGRDRIETCIHLFFCERIKHAALDV